MCACPVGHHLPVASVALPPGVLAFADARPGLGGVRRPAAPAGPGADRRVGAGRRRRAHATATASLVVPVRRVGEPAMLKLGVPGRRERARGAWRCSDWAATARCGCSRADPHRWALLLERLHSTDLTSVAGARGLRGGGLRCTPGCTCRRRRSCAPLTSYVDAVDRSAAPSCRGTHPCRTGWCSRRCRWGGTSWSTRPSTGVLIHGDLHYENVLAGDREPWLVIDPKPVSGDPHYEPAPMLWNRWDEAVASGDLRRRCAGGSTHSSTRPDLDEDRARDWVVVRMLHNAIWELEDHPDRPGPRLADQVRRDRQGGPGLSAARNPVAASRRSWSS